MSGKPETVSAFRDWTTVHYWDAKWCFRLYFPKRAFNIMFQAGAWKPVTTIKQRDLCHNII